MDISAGREIMLKLHTAASFMITAYYMQSCMLHLCTLW